MPRKIYLCSTQCFEREKEDNNGGEPGRQNTRKGLAREKYDRGKESAERNGRKQSHPIFLGEMEVNTHTKKEQTGKIVILNKVKKKYMT